MGRGTVANGIIEMNREYWDVELKNQSKARLNALQQGLKTFDGIIHNQYESKYFTGKLTWRNPLVLRISLPQGKRWEFISATKIWIARPAKISVIPANLNLPDWCKRKHWKHYKPIPLMGDHDNLKLRRTYNLTHGYIKDYTVPFSGHENYKFIEDKDILVAVLNGDLGLIL